MLGHTYIRTYVYTYIHTLVIYEDESGLCVGRYLSVINFMLWNSCLC